MQFAQAPTAPTPRPMEPVNVTVTLETPDDVRWFYHLMNLQDSEIIKAYRGNRKGDFDDRFIRFQTPEGKKEVFRFLKQVAADNNIALHQ